MSETTVQLPMLNFLLRLIIAPKEFKKNSNQISNWPTPNIVDQPTRIRCWWVMEGHTKSAETLQLILHWTFKIQVSITM